MPNFNRTVVFNVKKYLQKSFRKKWKNRVTTRPRLLRKPTRNDCIFRHFTSWTNSSQITTYYMGRKTRARCVHRRITQIGRVRVGHWSRCFKIRKHCKFQSVYSPTIYCNRTIDIIILFLYRCTSLTLYLYAYWRVNLVSTNAIFAICHLSYRFSQISETLLKFFRTR